MPYSTLRVWYFLMKWVLNSLILNLVQTGNLSIFRDQTDEQESCFKTLQNDLELILMERLDSSTAFARKNNGLLYHIFPQKGLSLLYYRQFR